MTSFKMVRDEINGGVVLVEKTDHTPGPWGLSNNATPDRTPTEWVIGPLTGRQVIARVTTIPQDARLIAAAPELLESHEDQTVLIHDVLQALYNAPEFDGRVDLAKRLSAALESSQALNAKARGKVSQ